MWLGRVQGPINSKYTGLPRYAAASIRIGMLGRSASDPVQAPRASLSTGGVHIGCAGGHWDRSSPAAENSGAQSGDDAAPAGFSTCGGTAINWVRRPSGLRLTSVIPDTTNAGSFVHTDPTMGTSEKEGVKCAASGRGLPRYQNTNAPVSRLSQRVFDLSCSAI